MHIPDGYLSPQTNAVLGLASALAAAGAVHHTARSLKARLVPLLSLGSAFSFTIMMFNVPIPDGTTAHATGGALLAILLGPWPAMISMSVALAIQAFFFGDGGILALGTNIFNMAVALPFVSYGTYRLLTGYRTPSNKRRILAAGLAGYIGINVAALLAGVEFGLQPILFHTASGVPLYSPYGLNLAVPAMAFAHLTVAGPVEAVVTGLVISYLLHSNPELFQASTASIPKKGWRKLTLGIGLLVLISPLGLLAGGTAWGEWGTEQIQSQIGYIPEGLQKFSDFWHHTLLKDYALTRFGQTFWQQALGYLLSAFLGLLVIGGIGFGIHRIFSKAEERHEPTDLASRNS